MNRLFSIRRRRPHYVDFWTPRVAGVDGYRLKWATNFDASFTTFITSSNVGFIDDNVNRAVVDTQPLDGQVRIVFDPTSYTIPDAVSFWLQFVPVTGGVEGTAGAPTLVLPDAMRHQPKLIILAGTAPNVTAANALQLDLPSMHDLRIVNTETARDMLIAVEAGGQEFTIPKGDQFVASFGTFGAITSVYIRGNGGTVVFNLSGTLAYSR